MSKELLEGYVGVKFEPRCVGAALPPHLAGLHALFRRCGQRLARHEMTPANGGNMSHRTGEGFVITTSGCNLGQIDPDELALVRAWSLEDNHVTYEGERRPSSEALLHGLILRSFPAAGAVLHAHDPATGSAAAAALPETPREEPYGTVALARLAAETFAGGGEIIVLKNHGYVAIGSGLEAATELVVAMHLRLLGAAPAP
jgi:ribulose-5-phosphate 4-epimerase/fuculose-1-phosphate aldolase